MLVRDVVKMARHTWGAALKKRVKSTSHVNQMKLSLHFCDVWRDRGKRSGGRHSLLLDCKGANDGGADKLGKTTL